MLRSNACSLPSGDLTFWELFDHFWARGLGNHRNDDGTAAPWSASTLADALGGSPDKRTIENWQSHKNMPSPENLRKISILIAPEDNQLRQQWYGAFVDARLRQKRLEQKSEATVVTTETEPKPSYRLTYIGAGVVVTLGLLTWFIMQPTPELVTNMRVCDAFYFDTDTNKCIKHVDVFVHGVDEVFLSFDFNGVQEGAPFERWWIHNGERVAGRSSFNDEAWPGYTFWRPGTLEVGQYVVRLVVDGKVTTQTFYVQAEGFT